MGVSSRGGRVNRSKKEFIERLCVFLKWVGNGE